MADFMQSDNFLNETYLAEIQKFFEENVFWSYGWQSSQGNIPLAHWNHDFVKTKKSNQQDCSSALKENPDLNPLAMLWEMLARDILEGHSLLRCYANAHTFGIEGFHHTDTLKKGNFTTIFYLNPVWKPEWAGETVFFNSEGEIEKSILPKPGRMIHFPGNIAHVARGVSRICPAMRVTLMFKSRAPNAEIDIEI